MAVLKFVTREEGCQFTPLHCCRLRVCFGPWRFNLRYRYIFQLVNNVWLPRALRNQTKPSHKPILQHLDPCCCSCIVPAHKLCVHWNHPRPDLCAAPHGPIQTLLAAWCSTAFQSLALHAWLEAWREPVPSQPCAASALSSLPLSLPMYVDSDLLHRSLVLAQWHMLQPLAI